MDNKKGRGECAAGLKRFLGRRLKAILCFAVLCNSNYEQRAKAISLLLVLLLFTLSSSACDGVPGPEPEATPHSAGVSPVFREFYKHMEGKAMLGPAISDLMREGDLEVQYLTKGKLVHDRNAPNLHKFYFAPLARENGIQEPPLPPPSQPNEYYIEGHYVYEGFYPYFVVMGKTAIVGPPLTEYRCNPEHRRCEQFFAGLAFYHLEGSSKVRLLDLGAWACDNRCRKVDAKDSTHTGDQDDIDIHRSGIDPTFAPIVARTGTDFTGFPLTEPYLSRDGTWKQIFENLVLVANSPNFVGSVRLGPMAKMLNIPSEPLRRASNHPGMIFYAIDGKLGYDIPLHFWEYILALGGMDVIGSPITHYSLLFNDGTYHQCFVNLCLMHNPSVDGGVFVRPEALGYAYKQLWYEKDLFISDLVSPVGQIRLHVWELYPTISAKQGQEIGVLVFENDLPRANMHPVLILNLPDGSVRSLQMPPTGLDGKSSIRLEPIAARGSSIVSYEVCILEFGDNTCAGDSFIIWNNP